jgi:DNA-binding LacI/PurR family transcriptional regulator
LQFAELTTCLRTAVAAIHTYPPLTTVGADRQAMGTSAVHRLHDQIQGKAAGPVKIVVYMHLVVRQSAAPP